MPSEEGWVAWQRYLEEKKLARDSAVETEHVDEPLRHSPLPQLPSSDVGTGKGFNYSVAYLVVAAVVVASLVLAATLRPFSTKSSLTTVNSPTAAPSITSDTATPTQSAFPGNNNSLMPGDPWDIYLAYYVECAVSPGLGGGALFCSPNGTSIYDASGGPAQKLVVSTWLENELTRQLVCANSDSGMKTNYNDGFQEVDKYNEIQVEAKGGLIVAASLVSPPVLELPTVSHVVDESYVYPGLILPTDSGVENLKARKSELSTYAGGYCIAHFHVNQMPDFASALTLSFTQGHVEWTINADEAKSHNFIFYTGYDGNHTLDLWNSMHYSSLVESFNH